MKIQRNLICFSCHLVDLSHYTSLKVPYSHIFETSENVLQFNCLLNNKGAESNIQDWCFNFVVEQPI